MASSAVRFSERSVHPKKSGALRPEPGAVWRGWVDWIRWWPRIHIDGRKEHGDSSGTNGAGFRAAEPGQEGSEAFRFRGQEKRGAGVVSAGLEPDLHERTCLLRQRHAVVR